MLNIIKIQDTEIENINKAMYAEWSKYKSLTFETRIECDALICPFIRQQTYKKDFTMATETNLREYFQNKNLEFLVQNADTITIECKHCSKDEPFQYILVTLGTVISLFMITAICAILFNQGIIPKILCFNVVDDGRWQALIAFSLQLWDFLSDINLSIEMWATQAASDDFIILLLAAGTTIFLVVPYIANLIIASRIKNIIKDNQAAKAWFQNNTYIFTLMVVVSGGWYAELAMVSSRIKRIRIMTPGLA